MLFFLVIPLARIAEAQSNSAASEVSRVAQLIQVAARKLDTQFVPTDWEHFPEVAELRTSSDAKRAAVLSATIEELDVAEGRVFPKPSANEAQTTVALLTRVAVLSRMRSLMPDPIIRVNDIILQDYFDSEIADLKLVAWKRIPQHIYANAHETRDSKRITLMMQDQGFAKDYLEARLPPSAIAIALAKKSILLGLMQTCSNSLDICAKMQR